MALRWVVDRTRSTASAMEAAASAGSAPALNRITITIQGVAAHAGLHPEWGVNALVLAGQALAKVPTGRIDEETTANFGTIQGGAASNIVPEKVVIEAEVRVPGTDESLKLLGVDEVRLLTNNPRKVEILTEAGINIVERVPLIVGRNPKNAHYLDTKAAKMGHLLKE